MLSPRLQRTLLDISYVLLVLGTICATLLSCVALLSQAVRISPSQTWRNNFDALVIGASYIILAIVSLFFCINRSIAIRLRLQRISKHHKLIGSGDVPNSVHKYITKEYARTCLISHESLPKEASRPGWGQPGTPYQDIRFRTALLETIPVLDNLARNIIPATPPLKPHARMLHHFRYIIPILNTGDDGLTPLHYYDSVIQLARYSSREPTLKEFEYGMHVMEQIRGM
ncbi:hypothetical protein K435DRAFT_667476 [Dendrothele bispora CBS 962.96]|uniref:Defect at low temperature protein 1 n=1 Tax=Dendrothele bispora (strain CBS 962.96) TaxID=1314807 RepID=A0A4S8LYP3_DENBC|nr:hypothetical protein K435DRAFT_667476 [Dendrothele bispora CBS 962.96]